MKVAAAVCTFLMVGTLASCAPQAASEKTPTPDTGAEEVGAGQSADTGETQSMAFAWTPESECGMCHSTESDSMTSATHQVSASHGDLDCVACHTDEAGLQKAHEKVEATDTKGAKRLKNTEVSPDACLACHEADYVPEAVPESSYLVDDEGTSVNPHDLPESESHATVTCANCHSMHSSDGVEVTAPQACTDCHHQNVYQCYTCHE